MGKEQTIYGAHPVIEAINSGKEISKILLQQGVRGVLISEVQTLAKKRNIPVQYVPVEKIGKYTRDANHQGVVAFISEIKYQSYVELIEDLLEQGKKPFVIMLDRITDVRNIGAIVRTAECGGVDAIVIPAKGVAQLNADAVKTSAGALLEFPICREDNLKTVINYSKQNGFQICAATEKGAVEYTDVDFTQPTLLIMGSEDTGISNEYLKMSTVQTKLPIRGKVQSLNVSVATGIFIYEVLRQRIYVK
ncbi:23S rRNA (guanosine(2251)-2'-O)-methyltransferase RlmB [Bacteroidales bacterium OttesenSCG-928-C19]|nr:23S rRNA (guanosine(2251)-2'-O)-methyltransferase RlmB [Bacteroidales bacterium OttesenSCG-928-C19]